MQFEHIPALADWIIHGVESSAVLAGAAAVIKKYGREESIKKNYPPHKHVRVGDEEVIIYPREYPPTKTEHVQGD